MSEMKKIYLLPNLFTLCNLMCGYWSITFSMKGSLSQAAVMIYFAMIFDALDGRIARMTNTTSKFGFEFDSIADVISFGVAPAFIIYHLFTGDGDTEKLAWWGCFIYVVCGALRLARYNVQASNEEKEDFVGLPIPGAAAMIASFVLFNEKYGFEINSAVIIYLVIPIALLMVSTIRFSSFQFNFHKRKPFDYLVAAVIFIGLLARFPQHVLLFTFTGYILTGVYYHVKEMFFKKAPVLEHEEV
ncbi:CDP-diacylglycerol--serine O-phosphatidyltransferase [bacterium]|nr:CDP-diacylglycerol--serine O-phosphatidyltransferase [bacterium]